MDEMQEVPMPPDDGAPFRCQAEVKKPPPTFWDSCGMKSVHAYKDSNGKFHLRCEIHKL